MLVNARLHAAGWLLVQVAAAGTRDLFIPNSAGDRVNGTGKRLEGVVQGIAVSQLPAMLNPDADRRGARASNHRPRQNAQRLEIPFSMPEMNRRCRKK